MTLQDQLDAVLAYHALEANGVWPEKPLAGLSFATFKTRRGDLVKAGKLIRTQGGRHVPVGAIAASEETVS